MNNIIFSKYGTFLSGRSLPKEILSQEGITSHMAITLDFDKIPAANQSFLNQLFVDLSLLSYKYSDIRIVNANTAALTERIEEQLHIVFDRPLSAKSI